ncbi:MAG: NADH-quinone oxidoreductase subunit M [Synechococcales cyanobacterium CRU_2_2]|nr:NADH-quinone oxidoreductase subunit M [Synechococcales cyanobacterium CRU_2_2]
MLSALIGLPLVAAIVVAMLPGEAGSTQNLARIIAGVTAGLVFVLSLIVFWQFDAANPGLQWSEQLPWVEPLGLSYRLGVDGLSLPLVLLNALLLILVICASDQHLLRPRLYYSLMLLLSSSVTGAFLAQDMLLFFVFYELELIPLYLLIAIWGGKRRGYASTKFLIYTAISGIFLLLGVLGLAALGGTGSFAYDSTVAERLSLGQQILLLSVMLIAFGIKVPIVPLHTWLPDAHVEASTPVSMLLAGVLLKLGTYGLLRFGLGLLPQAWEVFAPALAVLAVVSTIYGSLNAIAQQDMKKLVAYSSIGHMGYIILALAAATPLSLTGAVAQMVSHGLISALLFLLVGFVYNRTGTRDLTVLSGLLTPERGLPIVGSLMILAAMASSGLPGLMGFVAEFSIFRGSYGAFPLQTLLCMVGTGLTSVYFLLLLNRAFFGRLPDAFSDLRRVTLREHVPSFVLAGLIIAFGIWPQGFMTLSEVTMTAIAAQVSAGVAQAITESPNMAQTLAHHLSL